LPYIAANVRAALSGRGSVRILRLPQVEAKVGLKHTAIYEKIAEGSFPKPIPLGPQARGFVETEIDDWICAQIAKRDAPDAA
jgi:prophage regulatory protein